jgi:hypothetical protein
MKSKLAIILAATTTGILGLSDIARAGEGGVAAAAAFTIDSNSKVTGVAVAAAVGKQDAAAAAFNIPTSSNVTSAIVQNYAYSLGSAGVIHISNIGDPTSGAIDGTADTALGTAQANTLTSNVPGSIKLGTVSGDVLFE